MTLPSRQDTGSYTGADFPLVFPSLSGSGRGRLYGDWSVARQENCRIIEIPAGLIRTKNGESVHGLPDGAFLTGAAIEALYPVQEPLPQGFRYSFHTDPGFNSPGSVRWHDSGFVRVYAGMLAAIADHLTIQPDFIEIHAGDRDTDCGVLAGAMLQLQDEFHDLTGRRPCVLIENLTASPVHSGFWLREIWEELRDRDNPRVSGIVADFSGFITAGRKLGIGPIPSLQSVPKDAVRGLHVHQKHVRIIPEENPEYWAAAREFVSYLSGEVFVNPEVHTMENFYANLAFCREWLLAGTQSTAVCRG